MRGQLIFFLFLTLNSFYAQVFEDPIINENKNIIKELEKIRDRRDDLSIDRINDLWSKLKTDKVKISKIKIIQDEFIRLENKSILLNQEVNDNRVYSAYNIYNQEHEIGKTINLSGRVVNIIKNADYTYTIILNNEIRSIFPARLKKEILNLYKSQEIVIKGNVAKDEYGNIILIKCSFFNPDNYDIQVENLNRGFDNLINSYINILETEIKQKMISESDNCFKNKNYETAKLCYNFIKDLDILPPQFIENRIDSINKYIEKTRAIDLWAKENREALEILYELSFPDDFENTRSYFLDIFEQYIESREKFAKEKKDIKAYNDIFELIDEFIKKSSQNFSGYFKSKKEELFTDYENFIHEYLNVSYNNYTVVPGGTYYNEMKNDFVFIEDFLVNPIQFSDKLLKAYNTVYNDNIGYSSLLYDTSVRQRLEQRLKVKFISKEQYEYLESDYWENKNEKRNYKFTGDIDNIEPKELMLVKNLSELKDLEIYSALSKNAASKKDNYLMKIKEIKKRAYETGIVRKWYSFMIVPLISADGGGFIHRNSQLDDIIADDKVYFQGYPGNISVGGSLLFPLKSFSERFFTDNQVGGIQIELIVPIYNYLIDKSRIHNIENSLVTYNISNFSLKGFEIKVLLRNSGNIVLGVGYSLYKLKYAFELLYNNNSIYKGLCGEEVESISGLFGFYINQTTFWGKISIPFNHTETFNSKNGLNVFWSAGINFGLPVKFFANDIFGNKW
ncbi:MAG TPA: hypothetical protein PL041_13885 [Melioribacteraceae bacterium]|nr:hypothetical protein [Melioribacteraceae bacterium]